MQIFHSEELESDEHHLQCVLNYAYLILEHLRHILMAIN